MDLARTIIAPSDQHVVPRVNEQPGLATTHTLWLREHNRVALRLANINPHWSDDRVFLETRLEV